MEGRQNDLFPGRQKPPRRHCVHCAAVESSVKPHYMDKRTRQTRQLFITPSKTQRTQQLSIVSYTSKTQRVRLSV